MFIFFLIVTVVLALLGFVAPAAWAGAAVAAVLAVGVAYAGRQKTGLALGNPRRPWGRWGFWASRVVAEEIATCPSCGVRVGKSSKECPQCGVAIREGDAAEEYEARKSGR
jgi:predicted RNA-binding Zn-ribbon protein involved in translation (DUF1610 family)